MERYLGKYSATIYGLMRIVVGFLFFCHGAQKVFGWFGGPAMMGQPLIATGGIIELVGGALIAVGFLTGWAAFLCSGEMAVRAVSEITVKETAARLPKVTAEAPVKLLPRTVTSVPPPRGPEVGVTPVTEGAEAAL